MKKRVLLLLSALPVWGVAQVQFWGDLQGALQRVSGDEDRWQRYAKMPQGLYSEHLRLWYTRQNDQFWRMDLRRLAGVRSYMLDGAFYGHNEYPSVKFADQADEFTAFLGSRFTWDKLPVTVTLPAPAGFLQWREEYARLNGPTGWLSDPGLDLYGREFGNFITQNHLLRYYASGNRTAFELNGSDYHFRDRSGILPDTRWLGGEASLGRDFGRAGSFLLSAAQSQVDVDRVSGRALVARSFRADYSAEPSETVSFDAAYFGQHNDNNITLDGYSKRVNGGQARVSWAGLPRTIIRLGVVEREFTYIGRTHTREYQPRTTEYSASLRSRPLPATTLSLRYRFQRNDNVPPAEFFTHETNPLVHKYIQRITAALGVAIGETSGATLSHDYERRENPARDSFWQGNFSTLSAWTQLRPGWQATADVFLQAYRSADPVQLPYLTDNRGGVGTVSYSGPRRWRWRAGLFVGRQRGNFTDAVTERWFAGARRSFADGLEWLFEVTNERFSDHLYGYRDYRVWGLRAGLAARF